MKCPKCDNAELVRLVLEGTPVDQCPQCEGIWFDFGELEHLLEVEEMEGLKAVEVRRPDDDAKEAPCPQCGGNGRMVPVVNTAHHIHIDTCTVCYGKWLDGGELQVLRDKGLFESVQSFFQKLLSSDEIEGK